MTEQHLDDYMDKIADIETACEDPTTTKSNLETLINELSAIASQINADLEALPFPTTVSHVDKFILVRIEMSRKQNLHLSLKNLIKIRRSHIDTIQSTESYADTLLYGAETKNVENYVENTVVDGCSCMRGRKNIIKYYA